LRSEYRFGQNSLKENSNYQRLPIDQDRGS